MLKIALNLVYTLRFGAFKKVALLKIQKEKENGRKQKCNKKRKKEIASVLSVTLDEIEVRRCESYRVELNKVRRGRRRRKGEEMTHALAAE